MQIQPEPQELVLFRQNLDQAVVYEHLVRFDWRRQTDCVQQAFIIAALFSQHPKAVFVDGHINDHVKRVALDHPNGVKAFFNRRFHDYGFKGQRILYFDTSQGRGMGQGKRGSGRHKLHFHGIFVLPMGWSRADLKRLLAKVFGGASSMGRRQFHVAISKRDKHYTHNDVQVFGPVGKALYSMAHAGTTYRDLKLNDGKRSRKAPKARGAYNRNAQGLARGIPSNFNAEIVFCDNASKRAGKSAFDLWVKYEKAKRQKPVPLLQTEKGPLRAALS